MVRKILCIVAAMLLGSACVAWADWNLEDPCKWVQHPDISPMGIDVNASYGLLLADDFQCTSPGPITSIHIWGSWLNDILSCGHPDSVIFVLSIHEDIPDSLSPTGYSMPGNVYWYRYFTPGEFVSRIWSEGTPEGWMNPPDAFIYPADYVCWQYNFVIPEGGQFYQEGTPDNPITYWLDVKAIPTDGVAMFGWKTTAQNWNDDAVWGHGEEPYQGPWGELVYPPGHELTGSIDLAFVIVGGEEPIQFDWGDAPDSPLSPRYPTLAVNNGANHVIGGPWLGDATDGPDAEADGQPHLNALGDDVNSLDDEDGVGIPVLIIGTTPVITFELNGANGFVEGWIDFNGDQVWQHPGERVISGLFAPGYHSFLVTVPASAVPGATCARFRVSSAGGLPPWGPAADGEVEDYQVAIRAQEDRSKWMQRPDLEPTGIDVHAMEPYILADDFICTERGRITVIDIWGSWLNDYLPFGYDPRRVSFTLSFHADIPFGPDGYSTPGEPLWWRSFAPGEFTPSIWAAGLEEGWMIPPDQYWYPADRICWLYRFFVPAEEAFFQQGSEGEPIIYWLDVQAYPLDPDAIFGWKTSAIHWNDDAVWGMGIEPYPGPWRELRYPPGHQFYGQSIDLAFRLFNDPTSSAPPQGSAIPGLGLHQNVPNPFTAATEIRYALPAEGAVRLQVFDVQGRLVNTLVDGVMPAGEHSALWQGADARGRRVPAGIYFCRIAYRGQEITQKMMLLE